MRILKSADSIIVSMIALFAVSILVSSSYAKIDPNAVVGMWLFDEGEGEIAKDSSGNGKEQLPFPPQANSPLPGVASEPNIKLVNVAPMSTCLISEH